MYHVYQFHKLMRQAATPFYRREKCLTWTDSSGGDWREARWRERHTRGDGKWHCRIEEIFGWHLFLHHCRCFLPAPSFQVLVAGQGCGQGQVGSSSGVGELFELAMSPRATRGQYWFTPQPPWDHSWQVWGPDSQPYQTLFFFFQTPFLKKKNKTIF